MSLRCSSNTGAAGLLHMSFNQDGTCICVADFRGVRIFNVQSQEPVFSLDIGAISVSQMLFCTSLLAFVGAGEQPSLSPRKLTLFNTHSNSVIQNLSFPSTVLAVLLNRKRIAAILERRAFLYNLETLELLGTLDTPPNPKGVAALTPCSEPSLLALAAASGGFETSPGSAAAGGAVRVYDVLQGTEVLAEIPAHKSALGLLSWNGDGSLLASASQKGTVVRVHAMPSAATTHSLRRGTSAAAICSLSFTPAGTQPQLLCVASDHGSVHVYRLQQAGRHPAAAAAASLLAAVLPASVSQLAEPVRPLLTLRLPGQQRLPCICAVQPPSGAGGGYGQPQPQQGEEPRMGSREGAVSHGSLVLTVASSDGMLYSYTVEGAAGGTGSTPKYFLQAEWRLRPPEAHH